MKKLCIGKYMRKLWSCDSGAVAPLVAVCAIMLVGAVAVAVDVGRGQVAQSKLQAALDSAGLAAGAVVSQTLNETTLKAEARKYLDLNFAGHTVDATIDPNGFVLDLSENEKIITLSASATLPTTFMKIFGRDTMQVAARTEITREMTGLEVVLVLDVTGSMCDPDCSKRDTMKQGALNLVDKMFTEGADSNDLWIGIVPFSQSVNLGAHDDDDDGVPDRSAWLTDYAARMTYDNCVGWNHSNWPHTHTTTPPEDPLHYCATNGANVSTRTYPYTLVNDWMVAPAPVAPKVVVPTAQWPGPMAPWYFGPHAWSGCVEERHTTGRDVTDDPPSVEKWRTYFAPDTSDSGGNNWRGPSSSGTALQRESGAYRVSSSRSANKGCPPAPITPLTNVKADLDAAINALNVSGYTLLPVGAAWGWRMLSPEWADGKWEDDTMTANNLPLPYDEPLMDKVVIFLTDGNNDMPADSTYTAYGRLSDAYLGTNDEDTAEAELDARFLEICNEMKEEGRGIKIYTISVGAGVDEDTMELLKNCASTGPFYFHAPTPNDVITKFNEVADALSKLRVSK